MGISAFGRSSDWKSALSLLEAMKTNGIEPNTYSFLGAISACAKVARWQDALTLLNEMRRGSLSAFHIALLQQHTQRSAALLEYTPLTRERLVLPCPGAGL